MTGDAERAAFAESVRRFARDLPANADVADRDRTGTFARESWAACGAFGLLGLPAPESDGGGGADAVTTIAALESFGEGCEDGGLVFAANAHLWSSVVSLWKYGSAEQRAQWLPRLCAGEVVGCHAMTEPDSGSDSFSLRTRAVRDGDGFVITGTKVFVTNAPEAGLFVVFARTSEGVGPLGITAFLVPAGAPGLSVGPAVEKMGLRTSPMAEVVFDECRVAADAALGRPGHGAEIFTTSMVWERTGIMASLVGQMRRIMDRTVAYAGERRQFGRPIGSFGQVAAKIAGMRTVVDAGGELVRRAARAIDAGGDAVAEASVAKAFVSEAAVRLHLDALQIHGGYGYAAAFGIERAVRDALGATIYSGTTEIQQQIIARDLGL